MLDRASSAAHAPDGRSETLAATVARVTGRSVGDCYQCGRCAAGCPQNVAGEMDLSPTRIMRLLQLEAAFAEEPGRADNYAAAVLGADTCWLCAGCLACTTRCPQEVDIAGTMDVLRQEGLRRGLASKSKRARDIQNLHRAFLDGAVKHGRVHELFLVIKYKLRTGHLLQDALLAPSMFFKGKLHLLSGQSPSTEPLRRAIDQLKREEEGGEK